MSDTDNQDMDRIKAACAQLGEHFDTVQIFCTRLQDKEDGEEGTVSAAYGSGNWFARYGHVREWTLKAEERTREEVRRESET